MTQRSPQTCCSLACRHSPVRILACCMVEDSAEAALFLLLLWRLPCGKAVACRAAWAAGGADTSASAAAESSTCVQINQAFPASQQSSASFKWRDYSPVVFQHLREIFGLESRDYLLSLAGDRCCPAAGHCNCCIQGAPK